jgi:hypothetical protein
MRKLNSRTRVFLVGACFAALSLTMFSCLRIFRVDYPQQVETNSVFEVRLVLDDLLPAEDPDQQHFHYNCWGYIGLQLPVGWTIEAEDLEYEFFPGHPWKEEGHPDTTAYHKGYFEYDAGYVENCFTNEYLEDGYYFTGFSTMRHESECMDSIVVTFKIHTDGQLLGDVVLPVYVQENGDEERFNQDPITRKPLYPVNETEIKEEGKPSTYTYTPKGASNSAENCIGYLEIRTIPGTDGIKTVTNDGSYNVVALGNGQLKTKLSDSKTIGAKAIVYNMRGQIVTTRILNQTENVISGLAPGVYTVAIEKDGVRSVKKAIVK